MLILIADAHVRENTTAEKEFERMLSLLAASEHDVVFLGDIVDLWVELPNFPNGFTQRLLTWCAQQKQHRRVGFVEGNHEFFVCRRHADAFTFCGEHVSQHAGCLFLHGDRIYSMSRFNSGLLWFAKSCLGHFLLRYFPGAPRLVHWLKGKLSSEARGIKDTLPAEKVQAWSVKQAGKHPGDNIFLGHFHVPAEWQLPGGGACRVVPAWKNEQKVGCYNVETGEYLVEDWRQALARPAGK